MVAGGFGGAAWAAAATPGPLHAFFVRVQNRKGKQVAAVATARKIAALAWHLLTKQEDYAWARPALVAMKQQQMQLKAGRRSACAARSTPKRYVTKPAPQ